MSSLSSLAGKSSSNGARLLTWMPCAGNHSASSFSRASSALASASPPPGLCAKGPRLTADPPIHHRGNLVRIPDKNYRDHDTVALAPRGWAVFHPATSEGRAAAGQLGCDQLGDLGGVECRAFTQVVTADE